MGGAAQFHLGTGSRRFDWQLSKASRHNYLIKVVKFLYPKESHFNYKMKFRLGRGRNLQKII